METNLLQLPYYLSQNLEVVYTFFLVLSRYVAFLMVLPGIGMGERGIAVRVPAAIVLTGVSIIHGPFAALPENWFMLGASLVSEILFGGILAMIPLMIVTGVQMGAQMASSSMGLGASQLIDPTSGSSVSDLARIMGDLAIIVFLMIGGHHVMIHAAAGLGGTIIPGSFNISELTLQLVINRTGDIFRIGMMISAPVIVALLLTQFVMGLISRAVPTVNIFIVSFPLTIGIGLILSMLALPDIVIFLQHEFVGVENSVLVLVEDTVTN